MAEYAINTCTSLLEFNFSAFSRTVEFCILFCSCSVVQIFNFAYCQPEGCKLEIAF